VDDPEAAAVVIQVATETLAGMGLPYASHIGRERVERQLSTMICRYLMASQEQSRTHGAA
jgi:hypothetical protein